MPDIYVSENKDQPNQNPPEKNPQAGSSMLAAYIDNPTDIRFDTQSEEEKIMLLLRKHVITNVPWILLVILMMMAPFLLNFFPLLDFMPANFQVMALIIWYLLIISIIFEQFLIWFFNVYIITDERVVDFDFHSLLYKSVTEAKINKIQDKTYTMGGLVRTIFNYGDIKIQTAGAVPEIDFDAVPCPSDVIKKLEELINIEEVEERQ